MYASSTCHSSAIAQCLLEHELTFFAIIGALRATNNRGLQPAMDFILEHNDDPIPEPGAAPPAGSGSTGAGEPMDEDEDEDTAAIRAAYGKASANVASSPDVGDGEAKVRVWITYTDRREN